MDRKLCTDFAKLKIESRQTERKQEGNFGLSSLRMKLPVDLLESHSVSVDLVFLTDCVKTRDCVPELLHHVPRYNQAEHVQVPVVGGRKGAPREDGLKQFEQKWRIHPVLQKFSSTHSFIRSGRRKTKSQNTKKQTILELVFFLCSIS
jgi:hypothetical protein